VTDLGPHEAVHRLRVRYCETDRMGVTHHGSYIDWFEEARTEWLRARGKSYRDWEAAGVFLQIIEVDIRYRRPTTYDDAIEITTRLVDHSRVSMTLEYEVRVAGSDQIATTGRTKLACVDQNGKLRRLPEWIQP
jgi:acyl-CoA thioester hydrolase